MKAVYLLTIYFFCYINSGNCQSTRNTTYIKLEYSGPHVDKPIPTIYFSYKPMKLDQKTFGNVFKVKKKVFKLIANAIVGCTSAKKIDISDFGYYNFEIVQKKITLKYTAGTKDKAINVFKAILDSFISEKIKKNIEGMLSEISSRIY